MIDIFKMSGEFVVQHIGIELNSRLGATLSFFIEDTFKIFILIYAMLFMVSLFRKQVSSEKVKEYLSGKAKFWGYILAVILGVVTPFCSCSSIPLFIGFVAAGIPFGITMTFLISSPLISEIATVILLITPQAGLKVAAVYVFMGSTIAILGGYLCDKFKLDKYIKPLVEDTQKTSHHQHDCNCGCNETIPLNPIKETIVFANDYAVKTVKSIWLYVIIGLSIGAFMHGYVPDEFFIKYLGAANLFAVPLAVIAGIPIYANHNTVLPIIQVFLMKQVPIGTTLVLLMSITTISLPEMIMLSKILHWKMIGIFISYLSIAFIFVGYLLNALM